MCSVKNITELYEQYKREKCIIFLLFIAEFYSYYSYNLIYFFLQCMSHSLANSFTSIRMINQTIYIDEIAAILYAFTCQRNDI